MMSTIVLAIILTLLMVLTVGAVAWPLLKNRRHAAVVMLALFLAGGSAGIYLIIGSPGLLQAQQETESPATAENVEQMVQQLADRLQQQPDDQEGWTMLGRSYVLMGRYSEAAEAFQKAIALGGNDSGFGAVNLRAAYAEARALADPESLANETGQLFEAILEADPSNPRGLWYGGLAAQARGNKDLAMQRWQSLLQQQDIPPQFRQVVEGRLAALDPALVASLLSVEITAAPDADLPRGATLFVFIRDPSGTGGPPLAARRVSYNRLPVTVEITASNLIRGDSLPNGELEVGAVLSKTGDAAEASWRGATTWQPGSDRRAVVTLQPETGTRQDGDNGDNQ